VPNIKIRVGAAVDSNMGAGIFKPIVEGAKKARQKVNEELAKAGTGSPYRTRAPSESDAVRQQKAENAAKEREQKRHVAAMLRHNASLLRDYRREQNRHQRIADAAALRVSGGAVRAAGGAVRGAVGVAGDLARGAGVDFSLGNSLKQRMALESQATALSNSGYIKGDARNGARVDPRALMKQTQEVAIANGADPGDVMAGLQAFTAKTGDLQTARDVIGDLAMVAKATGASMEDLVSAAGDVSSSMGDIENKGPNISAVLRTWAGQGKLGAIELKDLAKSGATLGAAAAKIGGSRTDALGEVGAIVQVARSAQGGNKSAPQAATALSSLMATFDKGARSKEFDKAGVKTRNADNSVRSLEDIIVDSLDATKGDPKQMQKMFMDTRARSAVAGFESIYRDAGGGEKGTAAVRAKFKEFKQGAAMGDEELKDSHKAAMGTGASKAAVLKAKIEKDIGDALERAAPKLEKLGEYAGGLVEKFAGIVSWASDNPFQAVAAGLALSMGKSLGGEMMRAAVEKSIGHLASKTALAGIGAPQNGAFASPGGGGFLGPGGAVGAFTAALGIATAALAAYTAGTIAIDQAFKDREKRQNSVAVSGADAAGALGELRQARARRAQSEASGVVSPQAEADVAAAEAKVRAAIEKLKADKEANDSSAHGFGIGLARAGATLFGGDEGREAIKTERQTIDKQSDAMAAQLREMTAALTGGTLRVEVVNQPTAGPAAPTTGRTPR